MIAFKRGKTPRSLKGGVQEDRPKEEIPSYPARRTEEALTRSRGALCRPLLEESRKLGPLVNSILPCLLLRGAARPLPVTTPSQGDFGEWSGQTVYKVPICLKPASGAASRSGAGRGELNL